MQQRDFGYFQALPSLRDAAFVDQSAIDTFSCLRDAVIYCWEHRHKNKGMNERTEQSFFCSNFGYTASHFSRAVNRHTKAPMDLKMDYLSTFEAYTGNRAVTQYIAKISETTLLEEIQALRA